MEIIRKIEGVLFKNTAPYSLREQIPLKFHKLYLVLLCLGFIVVWLSLAAVLLLDLFTLNFAAFFVSGTVGIIEAIISSGISLIMFIGLLGFRPWAYVILYLDAAYTLVVAVMNLFTADTAISGILSFVITMGIQYLILKYYYRRRNLFFGEPEYIEAEVL
ncbi:MAG: hypothetical protein ACI4VM_06945 [Anaerovoracaceae bacterium]